MRQKFWDYIDNPSEKKKQELTSEELRFADRLKKSGKEVKPASDPKKK